MRPFLWLVAPCLLTACGGGAPLLHPAHALGQGRVGAGAGVSAQLVTGEARRDLQGARDAMSNGAVESDAERDRFVAGALAQALLAPGLAPWVGARAGVMDAAEAGITYSARAVRVDGRWVLAHEHLAASAGVGVSGVLARPGSDPPGEVRGDRDEPVPGLDTGGVSGAGFDVPLLVGVRTPSGSLAAWLGVRGGHERLGGTVVLRIDTDPASADEAPLEAERWFVLGVAGAGVSLRPVTLAFELDAGYQSGKGSLRLREASGARRPVVGELSGVTLTPAVALIVDLGR